MELSSMIGKRVLSPSGEALGYVKGAYLTRNYEKLSALVCIDGEEEEFYLPARAVLAAEDAVIAGKARLKAPTGKPFPVGLPVYTAKGESLGGVSDCLLGGEEPLFMAEKEGTRTPLPVGRITVGDTVILHEGARPRAARKRTAPKSSSEKSKTPSAISEENKTPSAVFEEKTPPAAPEKREALSPFDRCNLLGRRVKRSVYDGYGVLVAAAGERITRETLSAARRANRLLQLAVNTLTNLI